MIIHKLAEFGYEQWEHHVNANHVSKLITIVLIDGTYDIWREILEEQNIYHNNQIIRDNWYAARSIYDTIEDQDKKIQMARTIVTMNLGLILDHGPAWDVSWDAFLVLFCSDKDLGYLMESNVEELKVLSALGVNSATLLLPTIKALASIKSRG